MTIEIDTIVRSFENILQSRPSEEKSAAGIRELVESRIGLMLQLHDMDSHTLTQETKNLIIIDLVRRYSELHTLPQIISDKSSGHVDWLKSDDPRYTSGYWSRYQRYVANRISAKAALNLSDSVDEVIGLLEDPERPGPWDRRGMVVGSVQSGKTSHYTGLICKAADAGYKIIIVLAGAHNSLRSQTQIRLEEGFIGCEIRKEGGREPVGVGLIDPALRQQLEPQVFTTREGDGDFTSNAQRNTHTAFESKPWVFVVKKNGTVLRKLYEYFVKKQRGVHSDRPLLIIDDESDYASVDTSKASIDDSGNVDPTKINALIRKLLSAFNRSAYVAYTATPFANIMIRHDTKSEEYGEDVFPRSFIVNLHPPSNYIGPKLLFGDSADEEYPLSQSVLRLLDSDEEADLRDSGWMTAKHKEGHRPKYHGENVLPPSLREAIDYFLLGCAVRYARGERTKHMTMLVHVSRFINVQKVVASQVRDYFQEIKAALVYGEPQSEVWSRLERVFSNLNETRARIIKAAPYSREHCNTRLHSVSWDDAKANLLAVVKDVKIHEVNGEAGDALKYDDASETGLKSITIGGDKLSRGLTLEGLSVSYFIRGASAWDTLLQMGRWFGYRDTYLDICRLYLPSSMLTDFEELNEAFEEMRDIFSEMAQEGMTPEQYGLTISRGSLRPTAQNKMRSAEVVTEVLAPSTFETTTFLNNPTVQQENVQSALNLISKLGAPIENFVAPWQSTDAEKSFSGLVWDGVPADLVVEYLSSYKSVGNERKLDPSRICRIIEQHNDRDELTNWMVVLRGGSEEIENPLKSLPNPTLRVVKRSILPKFTTSTRFSLKRIGSPKDDSIDLTPEQFEEAMERTRAIRVAKGLLTEPSGPDQSVVRRIRATRDGQVDRSRALLVIYIARVGLDEHSGSKLQLSESDLFSGFLLSMPSTTEDRSREVYANSVYQRALSEVE